MSSSNLSTLLVQRLETALGVTLSAQGQLQSARSQQSVLPTGAAARAEALENATKSHLQGGNFQTVAQSVQASMGQRNIQANPTGNIGSQQALGQTAGKTTEAAARTPVESTSTRWSNAARSMVALLGQMPQQAAPLGSPNNTPIIPKNPKELLTYLSRPADQTVVSSSSANTVAALGTATASTSASSMVAQGSASANATAAQLGATANQAANPNAPLKEDALRALGSSLFATIIRETLTREIARPGLSYEATLWRLLRSNGNLKELADHPKARLLKEQLAQQQAHRPLSILSALTQGKENTAPAPPLSGALASLVQQQLEMHQQQRLVWQGEAWQGAAMTWEIQKDNPQAFTAQQQSHKPTEDEPNEQARETAGNEQNNTTTPWSTTLTLNLPLLGKIRVMVQIINQHVQAQYQVIDNPTLKDKQSTASLLLQRMPEFTNRLQALGLQTHSFEVFTDPVQLPSDRVLKEE